MSTKWKSKTNTGRVVYDRTPTPFTCRDVARITSRITDSSPQYDLYDDRECWVMVAERIIYYLIPAYKNFGDPKELRDLLQTYLSAVESVIDDDDEAESSDGEFGGGGASREY